MPRMIKILLALMLLAPTLGVSQTKPNITQIQTIETMADLKLITAQATATYAVLSGYYTESDGGGGTFFWNPTSTATSDDGVIVKPTSLSGAGRWVRDYSGPVNGLWFGMKSGTSFDNATMLQTAVNAYSDVFIPFGGYEIHSPVTIPNGVMIRGQHNSTSADRGTVLFFSDTGSMLSFDGSGQDYDNTGGGVQNLMLVQTAGYTSGTAIDCTPAAGAAQGAVYRFSNITITGTSGGLWTRAINIDGSNYDTAGSRGFRTCRLEKIKVSNCLATDSTILLNQVTHFIIDELSVDAGGSTSYPGVTFEGYNEIVCMKGCSISGTLAFSATDTSVVSFSFLGKVSKLDNQCASATGVLYTSKTPWIWNNLSTDLCVISPSENGHLLVSGSIAIPNNKAYYAETSVAGTFLPLITLTAADDITVGNGGAPLYLNNLGGLSFLNIPTYPDNASATAGGLSADRIYRTSTGVLMIRY